MITTLRPLWLVVLLLLATAVPATATGLAVYPGCARPPAGTSGGRFFYVDPRRGSRLGDGSRAHPWRTLQEVVEDRRFETAPPLQGLASLFGGSAPGLVRGGDTVYLLSGNHGVVKLQGYVGRGVIGYANRSFVTIAALPGEHPEITHLEILGAEKWAFRGLTFVGTNPTGVFAEGGTTKKDYFLVTVRGPHTDIIFDHNAFISQQDVSGWTLENWVTRRASGLLDTDGRCVSITGNTLRNIGFGLQTQQSDSVLISNNTIDWFADDGIDYGSSNLIIENNLITNSLEDGDGFHRDAMQGQPVSMQAIVRNVVIRNNRVIRIADKRLTSPGYLQGIDTFDGVWQTVTVTGNQVITDAVHGIAYYGVHDLSLTNNIVLADSGRLLNCVNVKLGDCWAKSVEVEPDVRPSINVFPGKTGDRSSRIQISNNITTSLSVSDRTDDVVVEHNACIPTRGHCLLAWPVASVMQRYTRPGVFGSANAILDYEAGVLFRTYDPIELKYDLTLKMKLPITILPFPPM